MTVDAKKLVWNKNRPRNKRNRKKMAFFLPFSCFLRSDASTVPGIKNHMFSGSAGHGGADEPGLESLAQKSTIEIG